MAMTTVEMVAGETVEVLKTTRPGREEVRRADGSTVACAGFVDGDGRRVDGDYDWRLYVDGGTYAGPDEHGVRPVWGTGSLRTPSADELHERLVTYARQTAADNEVDYATGVRMLDDEPGVVAADLVHSGLAVTIGDVSAWVRAQ